MYCTVLYCTVMATLVALFFVYQNPLLLATELAPAPLPRALLLAADLTHTLALQVVVFGAMTCGA